MTMKTGLDLKEYEALTAPTTIVANYASVNDAIDLSHKLKGKKHFLLVSDDPVTKRLDEFVPEDKVSIIDPNKVDEVIKQLDEVGVNEHLIIFPERAVQKYKLVNIDPLAVVIANKFTNGRILGLRIQHHVNNTNIRTTIACSNLATINEPSNLEQDKLISWRICFLRKLIEEAKFNSFNINRTIVQVLFDTIEVSDFNQEIFTQVVPNKVSITYKLLVRGAFALGAAFAKSNQALERVGLMLPTSAGAAVSFYACYFANLVPVMLNFGAGSTNLVSACKTAKVKRVYTARALVEKLDAAKEGVAAMEKEGVIVEYLEDIRNSLSLKEKLTAVLRMLTYKSSIEKMPGHNTRADDEAIILFTSGSEDLPKGVVLTHKNLVSNAYQILCRIQLFKDDYLFNSLPLFHSFGMIAGLILPITASLKTLQFPSPLMYKEIPKLIKESKATIFFSTSTFFNKYGQTASGDEFASLRLMVAGGEQLKDSVKTLWQEKFNKTIHEGYGVTETSPALSICVEAYDRKNSTGMLLPNIASKLKTVEGVAEGGSLLVKGPNIMKGYIYAKNPDEIVAPNDGWHDTGDVAKIDEEGFVYIVGRVKRFAKVAGEMVPLARIENVLAKLCGEDPLAVVAKPDESRGEKIIFVVQTKGIEQAKVEAAIKDANLPLLWIPQEIKEVAQIPLLATGKVNYPALQEII